MKRVLKMLIGSLSENANIIGAISGLLSILSVLCSVIAYFLNNFVNISLVAWLIITVVTLIITITICVLRIFAEKAQSTIICTEYYGLLHDFRNGINELECQFGNCILSSDKQEQLTDKVKSLIKEAVDHLVCTLEYISKNKISACVKLIDYSPQKKQNPKDNMVSTFVRDSKCPTNRRAVDESAKTKSVRINDNTDFSYFFDSNDPSQFDSSVFYVNNLIEYDQRVKSKGGYQNTTPRWQEYYIGTAVVPIRIKTKRIKLRENSEDYTLLGFLCVDSKSSNVFIESKRGLYSYILKSYAALIFQILQFYSGIMSKTVSNKQMKTASNSIKKRR